MRDRGTQEEPQPFYSCIRVLQRNRNEGGREGGRVERVERQEGEGERERQTEERGGREGREREIGLCDLEAVKSQVLCGKSASWRPRRAIGIVPVQRPAD